MEDKKLTPEEQKALDQFMKIAELLGNDEEGEYPVKGIEGMDLSLRQKQKMKE